MKQKIIGVYYMGHEQVEVVLRSGDGGEFYTCPEKGKIPRIKIGADYKAWGDVVRVALHEALEFAMWRQGVTFEYAGDMSKDAGRKVFIMRHDEFSSAAGLAADLLTACLPELARAWKRWPKGAR